jgi:cytidylate kinase
MSLITISRMMGAGAEVISERVARTLGVELYNDEKQPGFFERLWSNRPMVMLDLIQAVVYEIARRGDGVIVGHGGQVLLREFDCALHVHIEASFDRRVERIMKLHNLDRHAAENMVRKSDHQRGGFLRYAFNMNWEDPSLYDMVINTEKVGIDTAVQLIVEAARSEEIKACSPTALDAMARLALARSAEARLLEAAFSPFSLSVKSPQRGVVEVSGWVIAEEDKEKIGTLLKGIPQVTEVRLNLVVRPLESE